MDAPKTKNRRNARTTRPRRPGRSARGTSQMSSIARCAAATTAVPVQRAPTIPTVNASGEPESCATLSSITLPISVPITGNFSRIESIRRCWRSGLPLRTNATTVAKTSSKGNSEKNP